MNALTAKFKTQTRDDGFHIFRGRIYTTCLTIFLVIVTFTYTLFTHPGELSLYWSATNIGLLHLIGITFAAGLIAGVAANRVALTSVMYFGYLFLFVAVREQVLGQWDRVLVADQRIVGTALWIVLVFALLVLAVNAVPRRRPAGGDFGEQFALGDSKTMILVLFCCLSVQIAFLLYLGQDVFSSRTRQFELLRILVGWREPVVTLISMFLFPFLYLYPIATLINSYKGGDWTTWSLAIASVALGAVLNNPTIHPRFYVGTLIGGTAMLILGPHRAGAALIILIFGTLISPVLHAFRGEWQQENFRLQFLDLSGLRSLDFDAFSMICYGVVYHAERGILFGANILASVFFFVPRSMWSEKGEHTGFMLYDSVMLPFRANTAMAAADNLAAPIPIEGFLAFGWPGLVALSLAFGAAVRWLDGAPRLSDLRERSLSVRVMWLAFSPVLLLFLARGALLSSLAYAVGISTAIFVAVRLLRAPERASPKE